MILHVGNVSHVGAQVTFRLALYPKKSLRGDRANRNVTCKPTPPTFPTRARPLESCAQAAGAPKERGGSVRRLGGHRRNVRARVPAWRQRGANHAECPPAPDARFLRGPG